MEQLLQHKDIMLEEKDYKIYIIQNHINKKIYIGQTSGTIGHRFSQHKYKKHNKHSHLYNAFDKYGRDQFYIELLMKDLNLEQANFWEEYYIKIFDSCNRERGYNIMKGGENRKLSFETIEKIKKFQGSPEIRKIKSERHSGANSFLFGKKGKDAPSFGRKHTEEELEKMRGRVFSEEALKRISEAHAGENNKKAKHTKEEIIALKIEAKFWHGLKKDLAARYNMSYRAMQKILNGSRWKSIVV